MVFMFPNNEIHKFVLMIFGDSKVVTHAILDTAKLHTEFPQTAYIIKTPALNYTDSQLLF